MITAYSTGQALLDENRAYLDTNKYLACFFYWDAPLIKEVNKINYAFKCADDNGHTLLVIKVEPYNAIVFGAPQLVPELFGYLLENGYELNNYLCGEDVGVALMTLLATYNRPYWEGLAMDFMEARAISAPSDPAVQQATEADLDEIVECMEHFTIDCGLEDIVDKENIRKRISSFYYIKQDEKIASMARIADSTDIDKRITAVYTRPEYRGQGIARKVVNTCKNMILETGLVATLNVDKKNPISNHLYASIGFKRVFSQGEYRPVKQAQKET